jgi:MFS family permease
MVVGREVTPGRMTLAKEGVLISICFFGAFFGNFFWGALADTFGRKTILEIAMAIMFCMSVFSVRNRINE